jgi:hypothetical protein
MKRISLFILLVFCCVVAWLYYRDNAKNLPNTINISMAATSNQQASVPPQMVASQTTTNNGLIIPAGVDPDYVKLFQEDTAKGSQFEWKHPINFWGRVLDESNQPVADANVHFEWGVVADSVNPNGTSETITKSDSNGFFSLVGRQGKRLFVNVRKDGYYDTGDAPSAVFEYSNPYQGLFTPDQNNPVVFHLRKKGDGEPMIHGRKLFGAKIEGTPQYVDLLAGKNKMNPPGDLTLRFIRGEKTENQRYDWAATLGVPDGGLIESTDEFMFLAPQNGYQATFEISHKASDDNWVSQEHHKFYVQSRDGKIFSRIEITFIPAYNERAAFDIEYFINPSKSRNLEYDPAKEIRTEN